MNIVLFLIVAVINWIIFYLIVCQYVGVKSGHLLPCTLQLDYWACTYSHVSFGNCFTILISCRPVYYPGKLSDRQSSAFIKHSQIIWKKKWMHCYTITHIFNIQLNFLLNKLLYIHITFCVKCNFIPGSILLKYETISFSFTNIWGKGSNHLVQIKLTDWLSDLLIRVDFV